MSNKPTHGWHKIFRKLNILTLKELSMNKIIKKMITQAVNYEIENDEKLYSKIQKMRDQGGTAAMKEYWKEFRDRFDGYGRVLETEINFFVNESLKDRLLVLIILLIIINILTISFLVIAAQGLELLKF